LNLKCPSDHHHSFYVAAFGNQAEVIVRQGWVP